MQRQIRRNANLKRPDSRDVHLPPTLREVLCRGVSMFRAIAGIARDLAMARAGGGVYIVVSLGDH